MWTTDPQLKSYYGWNYLHNDFIQLSSNSITYYKQRHVHEREIGIKSWVRILHIVTQQNLQLVCRTNNPYFHELPDVLQGMKACEGMILCSDNSDQNQASLFQGEEHYKSRFGDAMG